MLIEEAAKLLIVREPFYGLFLLNVPIIENNSDVDTLCVAYKDLSVVIYYNSNFWNQYDKNIQLGLLKHEASHIMYEHFLMATLFENKELFNIAADLEINGDIPNLPPNGLFPVNYGFENNKGTNWYYDALSEQCASNADSDTPGGIEGKTVDDHSTWGEIESLSEAEKECLRDSIDSMLVETYNNMTANQRGTIPNSILEKIKKLLTPRKRIFNWQQYLRRFIGNTWSVELKKTYRKESKRFEDAMGIKHRKISKLLIALDTSGSVNSKCIQDFFVEIDRASKDGVDIDILDCDAAVQRVYKYQRNKDWGVSGRGGTDFQPILDFYDNHPEYKALGICTDGEAPIPHTRRKNIIWLITPGGSLKDFPGTVIQITDYNE